MTIDGSDSTADGSSRYAPGKEAGRRDRILDGAARRIAWVRDQFDHVVDQANSTVRDRAGVPDALEKNALASVAIAFSIGFIAAVSTGGPHGTGFLEKRRRQVRAVLLSGLTAALVQEVRTLVSDEDVSQLFRSITKRHSRDESDI